jgi:hypothetical protein
MKKRIVGLMVVVLFMSSNLNINASIKTEKSACQFYAEWVGYIMQENGGNYWEGYFGGYSECIRKLYL